MLKGLEAAWKEYLVVLSACDPTLIGKEPIDGRGVLEQDIAVREWRLASIMALG
jgi:hypothetical protein